MTAAWELTVLVLSLSAVYIVLDSVYNKQDFIITQLCSENFIITPDHSLMPTAVSEWHHFIVQPSGIYFTNCIRLLLQCNWNMIVCIASAKCTLWILAYNFWTLKPQLIFWNQLNYYQRVESTECNFTVLLFKKFLEGFSTSVQLLKLLYLFLSL